jgi:hypothetical protein
MVLAIFAMHAHATDAPKIESHTAASSMQPMHNHASREHNSSGCVTGCCMIGLCCCLVIAYQDADLTVYGRSNFSAEDGPSWRLLAARPLVPPPKSV